MTRLSKGCGIVPQCLTCASALLPPPGLQITNDLSRVANKVPAALPRRIVLSSTTKAYATFVSVLVDNRWVAARWIRSKSASSSTARTAIANRCTSPFRWCGGLFMLSGDSPGGAPLGDFLYFPSRHEYNQSPCALVHSRYSRTALPRTSGAGSSSSSSTGTRAA
jgi:hypothetical protein